MVVKSFLTISCFVVMIIANRTEDPRRLHFLQEDMNTTCFKMMNGNCNIVKEVAFESSCNKAAYRDTFCQVNLALLNCKGYNSSILTDILPGKAANCILKETRITLNDFCSRAIAYIESLYRKCSLKKRKRALFNIA